MVRALVLTQETTSVSFTVKYITWNKKSIKNSYICKITWFYDLFTEYILYLRHWGSHGIQIITNRLSTDILILELKWMEGHLNIPIPLLGTMKISWKSKLSMYLSGLLSFLFHLDLPAGCVPCLSKLATKLKTSRK